MARPARKTALRWAVLSILATLVSGFVAIKSYGATPDQLTGLVGLTVGNICLIAWLAIDDAFDRLTTPQVVVTAVLVGALGLLVQPLLEDDHFRYLWDGYVTATTGRPFAHAPAHYFGDATVPGVMQAALNGINNPDIPTIYGPVLQALFGLGYWMAPGQLWPLKLCLLCAEVAVLLLLGAAGVKPRWMMVLVLHPLVAKESAMTAHPDILIGAALLAAVMAWRRSLQAWAAVLAGLAVAMKISAIAALFFFCVTREGRFSAKGTLAMLLTLGLLYAPLLLGESRTEGGAAAVFGEQWVFNPLLFKLGAAAVGDSAARLLSAGAFALVWLGLFGGWIVKLRRLSLNRRSQNEAGQGALRDTLTDALPDAKRGALPWAPIAATFITMLLLSPVVNPWYWLWLLPLALLDISILAWAAASASMLAYAHVVEQVLAQSAITTYAVPLWATAAQGLVILATIVFRFRRNAAV